VVCRLLALSSDVRCTESEHPTTTIADSTTSIMIKLQITVAFRSLPCSLAPLRQCDMHSRREIQAQSLLTESLTCIRTKCDDFHQRKLTRVTVQKGDGPFRPAINANITTRTLPVTSSYYENTSENLIFMGVCRSCSLPLCYINTMLTPDSSCASESCYLTLSNFAHS
jgi:hypothetical protein